MGLVDVCSLSAATVVFDDRVSMLIPLGPDKREIDAWHFYDVGPAAIPTEAEEFLVDGYMSRLHKFRFDIQDVWMALRDYPALEYFSGKPAVPPQNSGPKSDATFLVNNFGDPVSTNAITKVDLFGSVRHIVDESTLILVNCTMPGHKLHEGYVARHVFKANGVIFLQTIGFGFGPMKDLNVLGSNLAWGNLFSIRVIRDFAAKYYLKRTGRPGIVAQNEPEYDRIPEIKLSAPQVRFVPRRIRPDTRLAWHTSRTSSQQLYRLLA